jgi:hypothetical protein
MWMPITVAWKVRNAVLASSPATAIDSIMDSVLAEVRTATTRPRYCEGVALSMSGISAVFSAA